MDGIFANQKHGLSLVTATSHEAGDSVISHTQQSFLSLVKTVILGRAIISAELPTLQCDIIDCLKLHGVHLLLF